MNLKVNDDLAADVCGTFYAAKVLGISVATVQGLVEKGELEAWKTKGGHRRIAIASLRAYVTKHGRSDSATLLSPNLRVLVVDDDEVALEVIRSSVEKWNLPIDCTYMTSAIEAMLDIGKINPDVLVSDLNIPKVDGFEFLKRLRSNHDFSSTAFLVITGLTEEEIAARGGVPEGTPVLHKPLDMRWIHGFMSAMIVSRSLYRDLQPTGRDPVAR